MSERSGRRIPSMKLRLSGLVLAAALLAAALALADARSSPARNSSHERERGPSPETYGLRPESADNFIFTLHEPQGKQYDPRARDLNVTALLARLGAHFDPSYMSVHKPPNATQLGFPFRHHKGGKHGAGRLAPAPNAEMPPFLRRMNFRWLKLPNGTRVRTHVSPRLQKKLQHFLWAWTACPVTHAWRDLGVRYWPRYVLEGSCKTTRSSCSVPPGMKCAPSERVIKVILRWQCSPAGSALALATSDSGGGGGGGGGGSGGGGGGAGAGYGAGASAAAGLHCQWMEINNFPIVTGCSCGCPSQNGS
ncbi:hypothetical protein R5R35_011684 [Gryllus longicercus]